ncbi:MAG: hypothetical protein A2Y77_11865 [Planctomycetes bacterium RBG_13_62_9]|nr:MAG: hypothetical protein A2Y77_11865 [Planctomycetes bacterium RBG_13_62_9]
MKRLRIIVPLLSTLFVCGSGIGAPRGVLAKETRTDHVVLQTQNLRLEIGADGQVRSLAAKPSGAEYVWTAAPMPIASVYRGGQMAVGSQENYAEHEVPAYRGGQCFPASAVSLVGDRLTIRFAQANVTATYRVTAGPYYLAFKLLSLEGDPVDRIDLVQLRIKRLPFLGPWIDVVYDNQFGVCLCAGNIQTNAGMSRHRQFVEMRAVATCEVALEGATAVLFGCPNPKERFLDVMEVVERDFQMPSGAKNRRSPVQEYSYLWCSPTVSDVDQYIAVAKRAGFRMILFSYTGFTQGAGHFRFNKQFPNGMNDLKWVTDRIRSAGLKVGMHIHYSKADRADSYVTPIPDDRLHKVRTFTLSAALDDKMDTVPVQEDPAGCAQADGRRILKIGKELVAYRDYTTQPPYQFTGCERGHLKTTPASHREGDVAGLLDVDDWIKFIRFDQDTDIQDEAARRIAEIVNGTGPYDMVYFDGAEDVHDPFWYHVANAQCRVYRLLEPAPPVCEAAMSGHFSWHMMSRGNAYDLNGKHIKSFCREISCRTAPIRALDFTRIEFGWIFQLYRDMGPDVLEYVISRGAAWDCPISLHLTLAEVAAHPRAEDCFDTIKTWEDARIAGKITDARRAMLKTLDPKEYRYVKVWDAVYRTEWTDAWGKGTFSDQEHHLFLNERGQYELAPIREVPAVADGRVKAFLFHRASQPDDTYVVLWANQGELNLTLPMSPEHLTVMCPFGTRLPFEKGASGVIVPVGSRRYLRLAGIGADRAIQILNEAK